MISLLITAIMIGRELFAQPLCLPRIVFILCDGLGLSLIFWQGLIGFALYTANHWLVAIGLSSHIYSVHRSKTSDATHWYNSPLVFAFILIMASLICFGLLFVSFTPSESDISLANFTLQITALAFGIRAGLGFVHFLYDRYIYKFSDEQVRATIGKDMFMPELSAQPVLQPQLSATST
jgi:hypothetical protein